MQVNKLLSVRHYFSEKLVCIRKTILYNFYHATSLVEKLHAYPLVRLKSLVNVFSLPITIDSNIFIQSFSLFNLQIHYQKRHIYFNFSDRTFFIKITKCKHPETFSKQQKIFKRPSRKISIFQYRYMLCISFRQNRISIFSIVGSLLPK